MGTFASSCIPSAMPSAGRESDQKGVRSMSSANAEHGKFALGKRCRSKFAEASSEQQISGTATGSKRRRRLPNFPARSFSDNFIFFTEKYSSGRRGVNLENKPTSSQFTSRNPCTVWLLRNWSAEMASGWYTVFYQNSDN